VVQRGHVKGTRHGHEEAGEVQALAGHGLEGGPVRLAAGVAEIAVVVGILVLLLAEGRGIGRDRGSSCRLRAPSHFQRQQHRQASSHLGSSERQQHGRVHVPQGRAAQPLEQQVGLGAREAAAKRVTNELGLQGAEGQPAVVLRWAVAQAWVELVGRRQGQRAF